MMEKKTFDKEGTNRIYKEPSDTKIYHAAMSIDSTSSHFLNTKVPDVKQARSLGSWVYTGPGFENEVIGKLEKKCRVDIINSSIDLIWHSVKWDHIEGWVPSSSLDFVVDRPEYLEFDKTNQLEHVQEGKVEKYTRNAVGVRIYPNIASHCKIVLESKTKVTIIRRKQQWYQIAWIIKNKEYKGWIPVLCTQDTESWSSPIISRKRELRAKVVGLNTSKGSPRKSILKDTSLWRESDASPTRHFQKKSIVILDLKEKKVGQAIYQGTQSESEITELHNRKVKLNTKIKPFLNKYFNK